MFQQSLRRLQLRQKTSACINRGQAFRRRRTTRQILAEQSKFYRLYLLSGKVVLAAMYFR
jgi:hypothetical protein